jgi:hypothetical protein
MKRYLWVPREMGNENSIVRESVPAKTELQINISNSQIFYLRIPLNGPMPTESLWWILIPETIERSRLTIPRDWRFVLRVNLIQMWAMKVIQNLQNNLRNILIQEFQHYLESKLIELMTPKVLLSQFVSTVNSIQTQSAEALHALFQSQFSLLADFRSEWEWNPESRDAES